MKKYNMTRKEINLMEDMKQTLELNPLLAEELRNADMEPDTLWDPLDTRYILDRKHLKARSGDPAFVQAEKLLRSHMEFFQDESGHLVTRTTDEWKRYPLEAMLRLLWRMRDIVGEVLFMRGNAGYDQPPLVWHACISIEDDGNRSIRCYDEERHNYMYMLLHNRHYTATRQHFFDEMRDFLGFDEDAVWIS